MKILFNIAMFLLITGSGHLFAQNQGDPAPDFEVDLLEGDTTFRLSAQKGKVVLVYLFGNGCPSCVAAGSNIETLLYQAYVDNPNFTAIGIDTWNTSSNDLTVTEFKNAAGISFPLALMGGDVAANYQTTYDRMLVIDGMGILVHKGILVAGNDIDNALKAINQSLSVTGFELVSDGPRFSVFPNPVTDIMYINTRGESVAGISLFDITGKLVQEVVFTGAVESSDIKISLQHLDQGIYLYSIQSEGNRYTGKLLIQR